MAICLVSDKNLYPDSNSDKQGSSFSLVSDFVSESHIEHRESRTSFFPLFFQNSFSCNRTLRGHPVCTTILATKLN